MSDIRIELVQCGNCAEYCQQTVVCSVSMFGAPDLDSRPGDLARYASTAWLNYCSDCFFCAEDIREAPKDPALLSSERYQAIARDERYPEQARAFMLHALTVVDVEAMAFDYLVAAWVCDDEELVGLARECRLVAAKHLNALKPFNRGKKRIALGAVYVDVLRRTEQFALAQRECEGLLASKHCAGEMREQLEFQMRLIGVSDSGCHCVDEVGEYGERA